MEHASKNGRNDIIDLFNDIDTKNLDFDQLMQNSVKSESASTVEIIKRMSKNHIYSEETKQVAKKSGIVKIMKIFDDKYDEKYTEDMKKIVYDRVVRGETNKICGKN